MLILQCRKILLYFNFAFSLFSSVLLVFAMPLMGNLNFHEYYILRFYPTRKICENFMHTKIMVYSIYSRFGYSMADIV